MDAMFEVHILNDKGKEHAHNIAYEFDQLLQYLGIVCSPGRELSLAKTKLEEACFFAKKAMATKPENQER